MHCPPFGKVQFLFEVVVPSGLNPAWRSGHDPESDKEAKHFRGEAKWALRLAL